MFKYLKLQADEENIVLKPETIHCDFEKAAMAIKYDLVSQDSWDEED